MDVRAALRRSRQVIAVVTNPQLRAALIEDEPPASPPRFDWIAADGRIDVPLLRSTLEVVESLLQDGAILRFDRVRELPDDEQRRQALSVEVVTTVFDRLGVRRGISEERLNAALAMLVEDVAVVRRDAVDVGFLERTPDGRVYRLRAPAGAR